MAALIKGDMLLVDGRPAVVTNPDAQRTDYSGDTSEAVAFQYQDGPDADTTFLSWPGQAQQYREAYLLDQRKSLGALLQTLSDNLDAGSQVIALGDERAVAQVLLSETGLRRLAGLLETE